MVMALAFKRLGRTYRSPLLRFAQWAVGQLMIYGVGFICGMDLVIYHPRVDWRQDIAMVLEWMVGILFLLLIIHLGIKLVMNAGAVETKK